MENNNAKQQKDVKLWLLVLLSSAVLIGIGLSFALSLIFFCLFHTWLEWKESRDCA